MSEADERVLRQQLREKRRETRRRVRDEVDGTNSTGNGKHRRMRLGKGAESLIVHCSQDEVKRLV